MWKENLYQPVEVLTRRRTKFPVDEHQHSFFEMVYVRSGSGSFYVKEDECKVQRTHYKSGALFLIPPDTVHRFTVDSPCEYVFIRFTEHYAADYLGRQIEQALYASLSGNVRSRSTNKTRRRSARCSDTSSGRNPI